VLKIIQVSDSHVLPKGREIFGCSPYDRLNAAIEDINQNHADAALCVFAGDLVEDADVSSYRAFRDIITKLRVPYQLIPGNHDERSALLQVFPETPTDQNGFIQSVKDTAAGRLLFLDTVDPTSHGGIYCADRKAWLETALRQSVGQPVFIFMHHPPFEIGLKELDRYVLVEGDELGEMLSVYNNIRQIFFGHVHRPVAGSWCGIPIASVRGTNHQTHFDLRSDAPNICCLEPPSYAVVLIDAKRTIVHFHDYLDSSPRFSFDPHAEAGLQIAAL
jgi:Icc protein